MASCKSVTHNIFIVTEGEEKFVAIISSTNIDTEPTTPITMMDEIMMMMKYCDVKSHDYNSDGVADTDIKYCEMQ